MKKWIVLVAVVLMAIILGLQHLNKNKIAEVAVPVPTPVSGEAPGVSLPPDAGKIAAYPQASEVGVFAGPGAFSPETACEGGSVGDILMARGKTWGPGSDSGKGPVLKEAETGKVTAALDAYFGCEVFVRKSPDICDYLSDGPGALRRECRDDLMELLSASYMSGKIKDSSPCMARLADMVVEKDHPGSGLEKLDPLEFCSAAAKGMENICASIPAINKASCPKIFPVKKADCSGEESCLETHALYLAVKEGDPGKCPAGLRASCGTFISKKEAHCSDLAVKASKLYCSYLEKGKQNSLQAIKERKEAEKRKEEERVQQQRTIEDINKNLKKSSSKN